MSYSAVLPISVTMQDGTPLMVVQLPVKDISDTFFEAGSQKLQALVPVLANQVMQYVDSYATAALWPTVRTEIDRATLNAETRTMTLAKSAGKQALAYGSLVAIGVGIGAWYFLKGKMR